MKRSVMSKLIGLILMLSLLMAAVAVPNMSGIVAGAADYQLAGNVQDGVILHAFNWSYKTIKDNLQAIAQAGFTTVQTSPVQQPKDYSAKNVDIGFGASGQWWKLYQPLSFSIAKESWLGTAADLKSLCTEAKKYNVKIIVDIVTNHMAAKLSSDGKSDPRYLSPDIKAYEAALYDNNSGKYLHNLGQSASDGSVERQVRGNVDNLPDLDTGNTTVVQAAVIKLLKECIDCGVDGFRFDAAKHIETPDDGSFASNFWPNILNAANQYASSKQMYYYGEVLFEPGAGRSALSYTRYMSITDNLTGANIRKALLGKSASGAKNSSDYGGNRKNDAPSNKLVLWAESHDTYQDKDNMFASSSVSNDDIIKTWALVGTRKGASALYFVRPQDGIMGNAGDPTWKSLAVTEINRFHNTFKGESEYLSDSGSIVYNERGDSGVVLVNANGKAVSVSVPANKIKNGTYKDTITGNTFTVSNGQISGNIGDTGVAVVYNTTTTPYISSSKESSTFKGYFVEVVLTVKHATSASYKIDNGPEVAFSGSTTVYAGQNTADGKDVVVTVKASNGSKATEASYVYRKQEPSESGSWIVFDNKTLKWQDVYIYVYDEVTNGKSNVLANADWPGEKMEYNEALGLYFYELPKDLANRGKNAAVVIHNNLGSQYPPSSSRNPYSMTSKKMIYQSGWKEYTGAVPPNLPKEPPTTPTSSTASTASTASTSSSSAQSTGSSNTTNTTASKPVSACTHSDQCYMIGDADRDWKVTVKDATTAQKHVAKFFTLAGTIFKAADADEDGKITVKDATLIQKYVAKFKINARVGQEICNETTSAKTDPTKTDPKKTDPSEPSIPITSVSAATTLATQGTTTTAPTEASTGTTATDPPEKTYKFTNNWMWSDIRVYMFNSGTAEENAEWPGVPIEYIGQDPLDENIAQYEFTIPDEYDTIIFNGIENGSQSNRQQSVDTIIDRSVSGYYTKADGEGDCDERGYAYILTW